MDAQFSFANIVTLRTLRFLRWSPRLPPIPDFDEMRFLGISRFEPSWKVDLYLLVILWIGRLCGQFRDGVVENPHLFVLQRSHQRLGKEQPQFGV